MMIYITGDTHGRFKKIKLFCRENNTTKDDIMIILGDAGINYFLDERDEQLKNNLMTLPMKSQVKIRTNRGVFTGYRTEYRRQDH